MWFFPKTWAPKSVPNTRFVEWTKTWLYIIPKNTLSIIFYEKTSNDLYLYIYKSCPTRFARFVENAAIVWRRRRRRRRECSPNARHWKRQRLKCVYCTESIACLKRNNSSKHPSYNHSCESRPPFFQEPPMWQSLGDSKSNSCNSLWWSVSCQHCNWCSISV